MAHLRKHSYGSLQKIHEKREKILADSLHFFIFLMHQRKPTTEKSAQWTVSIEFLNYGCIENINFQTHTKRLFQFISNQIFIHIIK